MFKSTLNFFAKRHLNIHIASFFGDGPSLKHLFQITIYGTSGYVLLLFPLLAFLKKKKPFDHI